MRTLFRWFYCLPIIDSLLLCLLAVGCFLLLRRKYGHSPYWKTGIILLFFLWIAVILQGTLGQRTEGASMAEPILTPFASYHAALNGGNREIYRTNYMNAVLFFPAGLLGFETLPKRWGRGWKWLLITVLLALFSGSIEYVQYRHGLGLAEVDDVIHNTLGALLGAAVPLHKK